MLAWNWHRDPETGERFWTAESREAWDVRWFMVRVVPGGVQLFTAVYRPPWVRDGRVYATVRDATDAADRMVAQFTETREAAAEPTVAERSGRRRG